MTRFLKLAFFLILILNLTAAHAQNRGEARTHKVQAGETVYSISHRYGVSSEELRKANSELIDANYGLKAGSTLNIPEKGENNAAKNINKQRVINIGVMLPLNNKTIEGNNMVEYYRGILMACHKLKEENYRINVFTWNASNEKELNEILKNKSAAGCDIIFGPFYSNQIQQLSTFAKIHGIRLAIPFAPGGQELYNNPFVYVLSEFNPTFSDRAFEKFFALKDKTNPIIIDCNDPKNGRPDFTAAARRFFNKNDIKYNITNLNSDEKSFAKAFKKNKTNVIILNSAGSNEFSAAVNKMKAIRAKNPEIKISMLGHHEWFAFEKYKSADFAANDVFIPTYFYYNPHSSSTKKFEAAYFKEFKRNMVQSTPRLAITGYDHAMFFLRGINIYGNAFNGAKSQKVSEYIQMPMYFDRVSELGGYQNAAFMFIHYKNDHSIESLAY